MNRYNYQLNRKQDKDLITRELLEYRIARAAEGGWGKAKWIEFCEALLNEGYELYLYEAQETVSKYITVKRNGKQYRVRFSNHPPIRQREQNKDCDFFVGKTNYCVTTTAQALVAVKTFFENQKAPTI